MWYTHQSNCECACVCVALAFALIIAGLTHTLDRWPSSAPPSQTLTCFLSLSLTNTQTHTTNTNTPYNSAQRSGDLSSQAVSSSLHTAWGLNTHNHTHTHTPHTGWRQCQQMMTLMSEKHSILSLLSLSLTCAYFVLEWLSLSLSSGITEAAVFLFRLCLCDYLYKL